MSLIERDQRREKRTEDYIRASWGTIPSEFEGRGNVGAGGALGRRHAGEVHRYGSDSPLLLLCRQLSMGLIL
jgi:hypothetical protein